jgi:type IV pilus assembly protein PilE
MPGPNFRRDFRGVSLIELMVVIGVIAVLSSIAMGAYQRYVMRTNRTDGTMLLMRLQAAEEKYFLQNNTYTANLGQDGLALNAGNGTTSLTTAGGYYKIGVAANANCTLATCYVATATATAGQVRDKSCPTFTIDDQGIHGPVATAVTCWH